MKTKILLSSLMSFLFASSFAQDRTTVSTTNSEISDNLDLRAVASIFGDSKNLDDFERRLNDPKNQISNLDLNNDNQVDYLRVIESVEGRTHLIVLQDVLGKDLYQDVATIEVEKDSNNKIQVQVVGDVYMYGNNYIYEPVYISTPIIYNYFWTPHYRPYYSSWYWNYYPSYYTYWSPFPIFRYRSHIGIYINYNNHYNYVNYRRCQVAYDNYYGRRANYYEREYPNRSFSDRNSGYSNRYDLDKTRNIRTVGSTRSDVTNNGIRNNSSTRDNDVAPTRGNNGIRNNDVAPTRENTGIRNNSSTRDNDVVPTRGNNEIRNNDVKPTRGNTEIRNNSSTRNNDVTPTRGNNEVRNNSSTRNNNMNSPRNTSPRNESSRSNSSSRSSESVNRGGNSGRR